MAGETVITVVGNLTADPELRFTPSGAAVANFTIASTPRTFDRQSGEWKDQETLFMRCNIWRQAAENVAESLTRGSRVIVSGRLKQRSFETKEGEKRSVVQMEADEVAASLRYATAKVNKVSRSSNGFSGGTAPADDPWVAALPAPALPTPATYFTDASVLVQVVGGAPIVVWGPGTPAVMHAVDEYVELAEVEQQAVVLVGPRVGALPRDPLPGPGRTVRVREQPGDLRVLQHVPQPPQLGEQRLPDLVGLRAAVAVREQVGGPGQTGQAVAQLVVALGGRLDGPFQESGRVTDHLLAAVVVVLHRGDRPQHQGEQRGQHHDGSDDP